MNASLCSKPYYTGLVIMAVLMLALPTGCHLVKRSANEDSVEVQLDVYQKPTIEEMAHHSEMVVLVKVVSKRSNWVGKKVVTVSEVQPLRFFKGGFSNELLSVVTLGGKVGDISQDFTHEVSLEEGETSILFLVSSASNKSFMPGTMRPYGEFGRIRLLRPTDRDSRLKNNIRLNRFIEDLAIKVKKEG